MWRSVSSFLARRLNVHTRRALLRVWWKFRRYDHPEGQNLEGCLFPGFYGGTLLLFVGSELSLQRSIVNLADLPPNYLVAIAWSEGGRWLCELLPSAPSLHLPGGRSAAARQQLSKRFNARKLPRVALAPLGVVIPSSPPFVARSQQLAIELGYRFLDQPDLCANGPICVDFLRQVWPKVSVIVVTFNQAHRTDTFLKALFAYTDYPNWQVIVLDNASEDSTPAILADWARKQQALKVVQNPKNRGFPSACNQAAESADGDILCLLNNDTVVTPGWLSALVDELLRNPRVGLVGATSQGVANEARVRAPYRSLEELLLWAMARSRRHFRRSKKMPMLALFCAATWKRVWEEVGGLDEDFGLGLFEDDDLCFRLRERGYELRCRLDSFVHHFQGSSFSRLGENAYWELYERNRKLFWAKLRARRKG